MIKIVIEWKTGSQLQTHYTHDKIDFIVWHWAENHYEGQQTMSNHSLCFLRYIIWTIIFQQSRRIKTRKWIGVMHLNLCFSCFVSDERDRVQKKTFTKWINQHLVKVWTFIPNIAKLVFCRIQIVMLFINWAKQWFQLLESVIKQFQHSHQHSNCYVIPAGYCLVNRKHKPSFAALNSYWYPIYNCMTSTTCVQIPYYIAAFSSVLVILN